MADLSVDISKLPDEIRDKLAELDLELSEGDITQKGYEKKRTRLLAPYQHQPQAGNQPPRGPRGDGGSGRLHTRNRRTHRRVTHNEKRYHSASPDPDQSCPTHYEEFLQNHFTLRSFLDNFLYFNVVLFK